jgi:hypothetical protein
MNDFRDLRVWDEAHHLTLKVYRATSRFPREEVLGSPVRCVGALCRSVPTSQKAAGNEVITSSSAFW